MSSMDKKIFEKEGEKGIEIRHRFLNLIESYNYLSKIHAFIFKSEKEYVAYIKKIKNQIKTKLKYLMKRYGKNISFYLKANEIKQLKKVLAELGVKK